MNALITHVLACGFGFLVALAGFVWLNRNKADQLDAAEDKVRKFKK